MEYKKLEDAPTLDVGPYEIWYYKSPSGMCVVTSETTKEWKNKGYYPYWDWNKMQKDFDFTKVSRKELEKTHVMLGKISLCDFTEAFDLLQGMFWSPDGEANELIKSKGLGHTSMSVGDLVILDDEGVCVAPSGWWYFEVSD